MTKEEFIYTSRDGATGIHAISWTPDGEVRGVLQIIHGMIEFIDRYDRFAQFMAENGFYVVGDDHLGHGKSVIDADAYGYFAHPKGNECVISDIRNLHRRTAEKYPGVPYFMLGHSMGSFLVRQYMTLFGAELSGVIVMGTGSQPAAVLKLGKLLARASAKRHGWHYRSAALQNMALGSNNKPFEPARTPADWLTKDEAIVDAYLNNPWNTFMFTVNGYYEMFRGIEWAQNRAYLRKIPKDLPVLFVSGENDPVGDMGKGVQKAFRELSRCGIRDLQMKLYPDDRHELLNETDHDVVDADLLTWIEARL